MRFIKKTLDEHHEIIKKTEHFLSLSSEKDADIEILTEPNWTKILDLLPNRIRVESEILNTPATNLEEKRVQYDEFKQWITKKREEDPKEAHRKVDNNMRDSKGLLIPMTSLAISCT